MREDLTYTIKEKEKHDRGLTLPKSNDPDAGIPYFLANGHMTEREVKDMLPEVYDNIVKRRKL